MLVSNTVCFYVYPYLGKIPILTNIFFKGVETTSQMNIPGSSKCAKFVPFHQNIPTLPKTNIAPETYFSDGLVQSFRSSFWSYQELTELKASLRNHAAEQREASGFKKQGGEMASPRRWSPPGTWDVKKETVKNGMKYLPTSNWLDGFLSQLIYGCFQK